MIDKREGSVDSITATVAAPAEALAVLYEHVYARSSGQAEDLSTMTSLRVHGCLDELVLCLPHKQAHAPHTSGRYILMHRHTTRATQAVQTLEKLLTVADTAEILGLSIAKIYELMTASPRTKSGERGLID